MEKNITKKSNPEFIDSVISGKCFKEYLASQIDFLLGQTDEMYLDLFEESFIRFIRKYINAEKIERSDDSRRSVLEKYYQLDKEFFSQFMEMNCTRNDQWLKIVGGIKYWLEKKHKLIVYFFYTNFLPHVEICAEDNFPLFEDTGNVPDVIDTEHFNYPLYEQTGKVPGDDYTQCMMYKDALNAAYRIINNTETEVIPKKENEKDKIKDRLFGLIDKLYSMDNDSKIIDNYNEILKSLSDLINIQADVKKIDEDFEDYIDFKKDVMKKSIDEYCKTFIRKKRKES